MRPARPKAPPPADPATAARILAAARAQLFAYGYVALTMDGLARGLGLSKKTLYVHFRSKDEIVAAIVADFAAGVRRMADELFADSRLGFTVKLHRFADEMTRRFSRVGPHVFRELQLYAPAIHRQVDELRHRNIPHIFGRILEQGQAAGMVRPDLDPGFAVEFWRPAIQGLMQPDTLERLGLRPDQAFPRAIDLFFGGLLTPAGRKEYEKLHPR